jgi:hypothetical protein
MARRRQVQRVIAGGHAQCLQLGQLRIGAADAAALPCRAMAAPSPASCLAAQPMPLVEPVIQATRPA